MDYLIFVIGDYGGIFDFIWEREEEIGCEKQEE
jgi:hypothetical protein